jgi:hypothetical protein
MTDTNAAHPSPEPGDQVFSSVVNPDHQDDASCSWEMVTFPDQLQIADIRTPGTKTSSLPLCQGAQTQPATPILATPSDQTNPEDLVTLIQDLNHCNDALLQRVGELEEALERSQTALQAELERYQGQASPGPGAPPPVAQLLSELDIANDGLRRTTIHNQTLQSELEMGQQRIGQLERECTLLQHRLSEKSAALVKAETTCQDLKSRLHRQQQYTLQFKAALEKCLNTPPVSTLDSGANPGIAMPKADQIRPWSAMPGVNAEQSSLTQLWHNLRSTEKPLPQAPGDHRPQTSGGSVHPQPKVDPLPASPPLVTNPAPAVSPSPQPGHPTPDPVLTQDPWQTTPSRVEPLVPQVAFTEPSPWGTPLSIEQPIADPEPEPNLVTAAVVREDRDRRINSLDRSALELPSQPFKPESGATTTTTLPRQLSSHHRASPSPLVYPLRSPKKITSLAAVELPDFGRRPQS